MTLRPDDAESVSRAPLLRKSVQGSAWTLGSYGIGQVLRVCANLLLARLLAPEAFGLMALVNVLIQGLRMLSDTGLNVSIIQDQRGDDPLFLNSAWSLRIIRGFLLWLICAAIGLPVALFYDQPELARLLPLVGLSVLIAGFDSTNVALAMRRVELRGLAVVELSTQLVAIAVMVSWAIVAPSVWALVAGAVAGALCRLVLSHVVLSGPPNRLGWDAAAVRRILSFGKWILLSTALTFLAMQADRLVFAKLVPIGVLGVYSIARMLTRLPVEGTQRLANRVVLPAYSRLQDDEVALRAAVASVRAAVLPLAMLVAAGLVAAGPPAVRMLLDSRYQDAGWIVQVLAFAVWFEMVAATSSPVLLARRKPSWVASANFSKLLALCVLLPVGAWFHGFPGAVAGLVCAEVVRGATLALGTYRMRICRPVEDVMALGATLLLLAVAVALPATWLPAPSEPWKQLLLAVAPVAVCWPPLAFVYSLALRRVVGSEVAAPWWLPW